MRDLNSFMSTPWDGKLPEREDYLRYFYSYAHISQQRSMLEDHRRTGAYYRAIVENSAAFRDKVVLDVGTGSGILAMFAAKAGARKVYAVEATSMADHARRLVAANGYESCVTVIRGTMESVELPEKVDIIISEWMGYLLIRESMLDSVIYARDRWLKPGGAMYPSHARFAFAGIQTAEAQQEREKLDGLLSHWEWFLLDMQNFYGMDLDSLSLPYAEEQKAATLGLAIWADLRPAQVVTSVVQTEEWDLLTLSMEQLKQAVAGSGLLAVQNEPSIDAIASWFDVRFAGSPSNPASQEVILDTAPEEDGCTHWGQIVCFLPQSLAVQSGEKLSFQFEVQRREDYQRLLRCRYTLTKENSDLAMQMLYHLD